MVIRNMKSHPEPVTTVCFSRDGRRALSASTDGTMIVSEVDSGHRALISSGDTLTLWDVESGRTLRSFVRKWSSVKSLCFSTDGGRALTSYEDAALVLWDLESGRALTLLYTRNPITALDWRGNHIALGDSHGVVSLCELENG